ncbi:MAG: hypothetical protein JZU50_01015 [Desulfobulbaceae bacterium]|nr:hypothetical protein [Desulfobulbaceae bacterium]
MVFNITSFVHKIKIDEHSPIFSLKNLWEGIMKKQFLKTALITMAVVGVMSGSAMAITAPAPMLEGGLSMTGAWNPIDIDGVECFSISARDITEQVNSQEELRRSRDYHFQPELILAVGLMVSVPRTIHF